MLKRITAVRRAGLTFAESINVARKRINPGMYFISRHGGWFRQHAQGYTSRITEAGIFDAETARGYMCVEDLSVVPVESMRAEMLAEIQRIEAEYNSAVAALRTLDDGRPGC